ncbi:recombinase family protein [Blautia sp. MSJ-36]|uniref:recombinase family protein n=1 Tax=Blautia sp. MSJ-36 TaxID=2841530 RepID=UPI001C10F3AD|nr:recombinase family protein [Blautia sp. MSJ-36]MBU5445727.1 recombinase family protein [Blautia sp. MSJ-36]
MVQEKLRAVFYARVSTAEEEQLKALPKQVEECKDVIASKGWKLIDGYVDEGKSGTKTDGRKAYKKLLVDMQQDKFEIVVVKSQDRLQRNTFDWYRFTDLLNKNKKRLFLYMDNKFYEPSEDALITGIKAILAEEYSRDLSKKLNNANKRRIAKARAGEPVSAMGNGQTYGYKIVEGKWVIDESQREVVRKMYELYSELHSIRKVRNALNEQGYRNQKGNLFTEEVIGRVVKNVMHKGWVILNRHHRDFESKEIIEKPEKEWVIIKNDHEAIVSEELWDNVNAEIQSHRNKGNSGRRGKRNGTTPLSGKIFCGCCGRVLWKHMSKGSYKTKEGRKHGYKNYAQWYCSGKIGRGELACSDPATVSGVKLNKYLVEMADMLLDYSTIEYSKNLLKRRTLKWLEDLKDQLSTPTDNEAVEKAMADLERKRGNLIDLYTDGLITKAEFKSKSVELDNELEKQKALLEAQEVNPDIKAIEDTIANIDEEIEALYEDQTMVEEKKIQFITEHIKKIIVLSNNDIFVTLDRVAGAVLFIDKTDTRFHVVPMDEYDSEELSRVGITENEIVPFDRESMQINSCRECFYLQSEGAWSWRAVYNR